MQAGGGSTNEFANEIVAKTLYNNRVASSLRAAGVMRG
jgi:hypothetical protein